MNKWEPTEQRRCAYCGTLFWPQTIRSKYCSRECYTDKFRPRNPKNCFKRRMKKAFKRGEQTGRYRFLQREYGIYVIEYPMEWRTGEKRIF